MWSIIGKIVLGIIVVVLGILAHLTLDTTYKQFIAFPVIAIALVALVYALYEFGQYRIQSGAQPMNPGEEDYQKFLTQTKKSFFFRFYFLALNVGFVAVVCYNIFFYTNWWLFGLIIGLITMPFIGSIIIRPMSELGWWFVQVPENSAIFVEVDNACWKIFMSVNDVKRRRHFEMLVKLRNRQARRDIYNIVPKGQGIVFLGLMAVPWKYQLRKPWYEHEGDVKAATTEPVRALNLKERSWNLYREGKPNGVIPTVTSGDPIDMDADFLVRIRVVDPFAAVYGVDFVGEATNNILIASWRNVVANLKYLGSACLGRHEGAGDNSEMELNAHLQVQAKYAFGSDLGLFNLPAPEDKSVVVDLDNIDYLRLLTSGVLKVALWRCTLMFNRSRDIIVDICQECEGEKGQLYRTGFILDTPAAVIAVTYGLELLEVKITDLQPNSPALAVAFESKTESIAQGAAAYARAKGERKATIETAAGRAEALKLVAKAAGTRSGARVLEADTRTTVAAKVGNLTVVQSGGNDGIGDGLGIGLGLQAAKPKPPAIIAAAVEATKEDDGNK